MTAARLVTEDEIHTFHEDGAVRIRNVIEPSWIERLEAAFEQAISSPGPYAKNYSPVGKPRYFTDHRLFNRFDIFCEFVHEGPLAQLSAEILGASHIDLYDEHLLIKEPGSPTPTYWHHDMPYFSIEGYDLASIWFSLDPVTIDSGALRFAKGSHKWGKLFQPVKIGLNEPVTTFDRDDLVAEVPDIDGDPDRYPTVTLEADVGDVIVFHGCTLHASGPNLRTDVSRRALSYRFAGDDIRWRNRSESPLIFDRTLNDGDPLSLIAEECPRVWQAA